MSALVIRVRESVGILSRVDSAAVSSYEGRKNAARLAGRILLTAGGLALAWYTVSFFCLFMR